MEEDDKGQGRPPRDAGDSERWLALDHELIVGQSSTIRRLALADVRNGKRALLDIISRYPRRALAASVPGDGTEDYLRAETWQAYGEAREAVDSAAQGRSGGRTPVPRSLVGAAGDDATMVYIAGQAPETLTRMYMKSGKVRFKVQQSR